MQSFFKKISNKLNMHDGFLKSIGILAGGTAFAQVIAVLVLPIVTRLYSPNDFSIFATYSSLLAILAVASCLRFEIAIPLPEKDEDALSLLVIALICNLLITLILSLIIFYFKYEILSLIRLPELSNFIWFIPLGVFLAGLYNSLQYWSTREKKFYLITKTRITQSIMGSITQITLGFILLGALGLILGRVVNISAGISKLFRSLYKNHSSTFNKITKESLLKNLKAYDKFPKFSTWEALANIASIQLPILIIASVAIGPKAGYLMLAMKVLSIPIGLVGGAISQVYLSHASKYYLKGNLNEFTKNTISKIAKIAIIPLILLGLIAPMIFPIVFGSAWGESGNMLLWMVPWFIMQILSSPVSMSLHITNNQEIALFLQCLGFVLRVGGLLAVSVYYKNFTFEYYAISGFIFYSIYLLVILHIIKDK